MKTKSNLAFWVSAFACVSTTALAGGKHASIKPQGHAPIGVMGDHLHKAGEWMMSYRYMTMSMSGNQQGSKSIIDNDIATGIENPFANPPMSPPTVRVVPQDMTTQMHMFGVMYAPSDDITLMAMVNYLDKEMDLKTYQGGMGVNVLGRFTTNSSGISDAKLGLLYRLYDNAIHHVHLNANWQVPTGNIDESGEALTPMNMKMTMRLPYGMQLGTGSNHLELGATYNGFSDEFSWGGQALYNAVIDDNDEDYRWGDSLTIQGWASYQVSDAISASLRVIYRHQDEIDGMDKMIMAPVTTANSANYGGNFIDTAIGVNTVVANKHRFALEYQLPIEHDVNGVQMEMEHMVTLGYQLAF